MPITFACPKCRQSVIRPDNDAGTKIMCPACNQKLRVPVPPAQADKTMLGELRTPESRTLLGEMLPMPAPASIAMPIRCVCPQCKSVIKADPRRGGTRASCPGCGCPVEIPVPKAELVDDVQPTPIAESDPQASTAEEFTFTDEQASGQRTSRRRPGSSPWRALVIAGMGIVGAVVLAVFFVAKNASKDDKDLIYEAVQRLRFRFAGDKITINDGRGNPQKEVSFRLDPKQRPKTLDLIPPTGDDTMFAVYELDGDVLKIGQYASGESQAKRRRPLEVRAGADVWVLTFKRERQ